MHTARPIYVVPLHPHNADQARPRVVSAANIGNTASPVFSPSGRSLAWCEMATDANEADRLYVVVLDDIEGGHSARRIVTADWDRSAASVAWSEDGKSLFITAEDEAHVKLFVMPADGSSPPVAVTHTHTVSSFSVLPTPVIAKDGVKATRVLLNINSFTSPNTPHLLTVGAAARSASSTSPSLEQLYDPAPGLKRFDLDSGEEFWFEGAYVGQKSASVASDTRV